ncbi:MAG: hypothetical protein KGS60_17345 [Verrucomicrobia bacterium]|nr:hypothetical protein [Verrucomicrobiota bacterium]
MRFPPLPLLLALCLPPGPCPADSVNTFLGTQAIGGRYHFTEDQPLLESAKRIAELGAASMKFSLSPQASFGKSKANVLQHPPERPTLAGVAGRDATHRAVLDMPFTHFFLWAYPFTTTGTAGTFNPTEREREYREIHDLAAHLLRTYSGSGKQFYLGHWEGDWHLRPGFDPAQPFPESFRDRFIAWLGVRQQAIDDAKRDTPHENVGVWHYTEVNLVQGFLGGGSCLTNDILPEVDVDFVSYSCYDSLQGEIRKDLPAALTHIESKLKPKPAIPGKRVFLGEYGFPARLHPPEEQARQSVEVMITAIEWGCPFILYWELYDNEGTPERPGGFWLIDQSNRKQPLWHTHRNYFEWAEKAIADTRQRLGRPPTDAEFRVAALAYLRAVQGAAFTVPRRAK